MVVVTGRGAGGKVKALSSSSTPTKSKAKDKVTAAAAASKLSKSKELKDAKSKKVNSTPDKETKPNGSADKGKSPKAKVGVANTKKEEITTKNSATKVKAGTNGVKRVDAKKELSAAKSRSCSPAVVAKTIVKLANTRNTACSVSDKLKTVRPPSQSPTARIIPLLGPRIQAQRKFAQAGHIYTGTLHFNQPIPSNSPYATPSKSKESTPLKLKRSHEGGSGCVKKVKKPLLSPPPVKRPKTEDFLTFLCVRGTPAMPPELDFFNYPQVFDLEAQTVPKKNVCSSVLETAVVEIKETVSIELQSDNQAQSSGIKTNCKGKPSHKQRENSKNGHDLESRSSTSTETDTANSACTAENPTKGIRATASSVLFSKFKKTSPITKTQPIISPPRSRINEQDARFAMTALKLKYQRLAGNKPNRSALLTKKAKESIILTRSKSRTPFSGKLYPKIGKLVPRPMKPVVISPSRNAPSPDIIYGVTSVASAARKRATKSSSALDESGTASEDDEDRSEEGSNESSTASESESEKPKTTKPVEQITRSLRNGKEFTRPKSNSPVAVKKQIVEKKNDKSPERRVGTRSAHRLTKSPLREIPMYNLKLLKQKVKKKLNAKNKSKYKDDKPKKNDKKNDERKDIKSATPKKAADKLEDGKRPSRKTKETAANLLGLFTQGFTTDEEDSDNGKRHDKEEDSDVGSSSSSDTKYLEKHYNAALRREEEKFLKKKKSKTEIKTRSSNREVFSPKSEKKDSKVSKRKLRSQSFNKEDDKLNSMRKRGCRKSVEKFKTRSRQGTPTVGDRKMPGAARKSAAITCSRKSRYSSSEEEEKSSEDEQDSEKEESEDEAAESYQETSSKKRTTSKKIVLRKQAKKVPPVKKSKKPNPPSDSEGDSESEETDEQKDDSDKKDEESEDEEEIGKDIKPDISAKLVNSKNRKSSKKPQVTNQINIKMEMEQSSSESSAEESNNPRSFKREYSVETEQCKMSPMISNSVSRSPSKSNELKGQSSCEENDTSSSAAEESEDDDAEDEEIPEKVDMSTQVDMDEEEGIIPSSSSISCEVQTSRLEKKEQSSGTKQDSDDEVQEVGVVFASSSSTSTGTHARHSTSRRNAEKHSTPAYSSTSTASSSPFHHHHQHHQPSSHPAFHHPQPQHVTPTLDPLHNNPFSPFLPPPRQPLQQEFYTPLQLAPPLVHSSIQLMGGSLAPSYPVSNPLNTLSIPVSVPFSSHLLPHHPSIGFATGSTFHATTLQTHVRSIATNLDIPLVRPVMGTDHSSLHFMSRGPTMGIPNSTPLTRPTMAGVWGQAHADHTSSPNHFSAFRMPHSGSTTHTHTTQHVIHHQSTTVLGMNSTPILPVSIIQPQQHHHHQTQQHHSQHQTPSYSQTSSHSSHQHHHKPSPSKSKGSHGSSKRTHHGAASTCSSVPSTSTTVTSQQRPKSPTPPGYHLIKHLPNVSIVPKFDRTCNPTSQMPSQEPGTSGSSKKETAKKEPGEKKKVGRKRKDSAVLPQPLSPLTVRKDSNPSTYAPKKLQKDIQGSNSTSSNTVAANKKSCAKSCNSSSITSPVKPETGDKFGKLLKKNDKGKNSPSPAPSCSSSSTIVVKRDKSISPLTPKIKKSKDKDEPSSSKSNSLPPSRTSSPNVQPKPKALKGSTNRSGITDAPTFYPNEQDFEDPLKYIQKIQKEAEKFGMARIVPPKSFRPECKVEDHMKFKAHNHYVHKMYQRWGPSVLESQAIQENLKQTHADLSEVPMISGVEVNLSTLYQTVQSYGGLTEVIEKQKWTKVADAMHMPPKTHDRATKLDAIYVKYVLSYETLSDSEREKLKKKVEKKWAKRRDAILKAAENSDEEELEDSMDEVDECIVEGKQLSLSSFYNVAKKTLNIFFPTEKEFEDFEEFPYSCDEMEEEYWKIVKERNHPVCVYSGSIDCAGEGWGFPITKAANQHPWNLKVLANNQGSVLRSMGPVMGATVPTLHVAMLFTSYCWYRDPHSLPWVEYLHSGPGANKIWYSVAAANEHLFRAALTELMPMQCKEKKIWLASDSAMVPPDVLVSKGVPLVRAVQNPGEFLVVFPKAFTSAICTGYLISESVCFAYPSWLQTCVQTFKDIHESKEPPVFPLEKLLLSILQDARASLDVVRNVLLPAKDIIKDEIALRKKIKAIGVKYGGKMTNKSEGTKTASKRSSNKKSVSEEEAEIEQCYTCNYSLYLSIVRNTKKDSVMCLKHAIEHFGKYKADIKKSTLFFDLDETQLETIVENASKRCGNMKSRVPADKS